MVACFSGIYSRFVLCNLLTLAMVNTYPAFSNHRFCKSDGYNVMNSHSVDIL